jgi:diaminopropionate ammonia-lyase
MVDEVASGGIRYVLTTPSLSERPAEFSESVARQVLRFHQTLPGYRPTRLVGLSQLARRWKVGHVLVKDESRRFGLKAFKALGGSYAVLRLLCRQLGLAWQQADFSTLRKAIRDRGLETMTLTTATDGNHGRGVAWVAEQLGLEAVVFMPAGSVPSRVNAIRDHGARVDVTDMNYDDTVRLAWRTAQQNGWLVIQDTVWKGYSEVPRWIMQGYTTMSMEAVDQMADLRLRPSHVVVQAGVGAFAAAMVAYLAGVYKDRAPRFIVVEPTRAACMLASSAAGDSRPRAVGGDLDTIMVGLACGEPSPPAWKILQAWACAFMSCENYVAANGMRILANPLAGDDPVEAGESGAVGVGLLDLLVNHPDCETLRRKLQIGPQATMLVFNTEGATDPVNYRDVVWYGKYSG